MKKIPFHFLPVVSLLVVLFLPHPADAGACAVKNDYTPAQCSNQTFTANNDAELDQYIADFGFDKGKYKNLLINYDVSRTDIEVHSPCAIALFDMVALTANSVCLDATEGISNDNGVNITANAGGAALLSEKGSVELGKTTSIAASSLTATALDTVKIGEGSNINATGPVALTSTGSSNTSKILIGDSSTVAATDLTFSAYGVVNIIDMSVVNASGTAVLTSTGTGNQSQVKIGKNVVLTGNSVDITSGSKAILSKDSNVTSAANFNMQAGTDSDCIIDSSAVFSATSLSGNCLDGIPVIPNVVGLLKTDAESAILGAGFSLGNILGAYSLVDPTHEVLSQSPAAGTIAALGTAVDFNYVLPPPAGDAALTAAWDGLWEISVTYRNAEDGSPIGTETATNVLCEGDSTGAALAQIVVNNIPFVNSFQCADTATDEAVGATCRLEVELPDVCAVEATLLVEADLSGDTITGNGTFDAISFCDFENHQTIEISGTRLGPDDEGICDDPSSSIIQKFLSHPTGQFTTP